MADGDDITVVAAVCLQYIVIVSASIQLRRKHLIPACPLSPTTGQASSVRVYSRRAGYPTGLACSSRIQLIQCQNDVY